MHIMYLYVNCALFPEGEFQIVWNNERRDVGNCQVVDIFGARSDQSHDSLLTGALPRSHIFLRNPSQGLRFGSWV